MSNILLVSSELGDEAYDALVEVLRLYESLKLKGQRASKKSLKDNVDAKTLKLSFPCFKLRCLRGNVTNSEMATALNKVIRLEFSLREMEQELSRIKEMRALQNFFVKKTDCDTWEKSKEKYIILFV